MVKADAVLTKIADATLKEGQRLGMLDSRWTAEQYNPHILHPQGEGEYAEPGWVARQAGKAAGRQDGESTSGSPSGASSRRCCTRW